MKTDFENNKYYSLGKYLTIFIGFCFLLYLLLFAAVSGRSVKSSSIPVLDKSRLERVSDKLNQRQDVNTQGKPDITKFDFGKNEPF